MATVRVSLLGRFKVECDHTVLSEFESRKAQELFCYLLIYRARSHPRETLASFLWSDVSTSKSKKYLRQAIWQLQKMLSEQAGDGEEVVSVEPEWLTVQPNADLWVDVTELEEAYNATQTVAADQLTPAQVRQAQQAVQLYQGDLLEGWYQDWCIFERERCQRIYLLLLDKLLEHCTVTAAYGDGVAHGLQILRHDRAHERTHRRLMHLYFLSGDRTAALRQYAACVDALAEELSVEPAQSTQILYEQICSGASAASTFARDPSSPSTSTLSSLDLSSPDPSSPSDLSTQLRQIQANLWRLQDQVELCLQSLQNLVKHHHP